MKQKFSIVIPVYNVAPYLRQCLDSLLAQSYKDFEVICVDDGSTDGSGEILDEYSDRDCRLRVVHQTNSGVSAARNKGLEEAAGDWMLFLDADDYIESDLLHQLAESIPVGVDVVGYLVKHIEENGSPSKIQRNQFVPIVTTGDRLLLEDRRYGCYQSCGWDKIYRRDFLNQKGLSYSVELKLGEDVLFAQMALALASKVAVLATEAAYCYRNRSGSATDHLTIERELDGVKKLKILVDFYRRNKRPGLAKSICANIRTMIIVPFRNDPALHHEWLTILLRQRSFRRLSAPFLLVHGKMKMKILAVLLLLPNKWLVEVLSRI